MLNINNSMNNIIQKISLSLIFLILICTSFVSADISLTNTPTYSDVSSCKAGCICNNGAITCPTDEQSTITKKVEDTNKQLINQNPLSVDEISNKIVTHGYNLVNQYLLENPNPVTFSGGEFSFSFANNITIHFSPARISGKFWRAIEFGYPDGTVMIVILDGPVYGDPGKKNEISIKNVKGNLSSLLTNESLVKRIQRENTNLNLRDGRNFSIFIGKMFEAINVSLDTSEEPTSSIITFFRTDTNQTLIENGKVTVVTSESVSVIDEKFIIQISSNISKEILILPEEASSKTTVKNIDKIELIQEKGKPVYSISANEKGNFIGILPISANVNQKIDGENGIILATEKPWWAFLASGI